MERTLYISDLDGTLLQNDARLSQHTMEILNKKIEGGLLFSYATARSLTSAAIVTRGLVPRIPVICNNGVFIVDPNTGERLHSCMLDKDKVQPVLSAIQEAEIPVFVYAFIDGNERVSWIKGSENDGMDAYLHSRTGDSRLRCVESYTELFAGDIFYFTIIGTKEKAGDFFKLCNQSGYCHYSMIQDTYNTGEWWLEIYRYDASKASAVRKLKELAGADRIVAFGDNLNDIPLFEASDMCYAVANAKDELKDIATGVIGANADDGVATWILENVMNI